MGLLGKLKEIGTFALDLTSAVAKNPLAILSPKTEAAKIKQLRADITAGDTAKAVTYAKTLAVQTAVNVGTVLGGAGVLGAGAKTAVTAVTSKAAIIGLAAAPLVVGSKTIRETVAGTSPVELGVKAGEKLEKAITGGSEKASTAATVLGTVAAGAVGAGLLIAGKEIYENYKEGKEVETVGEVPTSSLTPVIATNQSVPVVPATTTVTTGTATAGGKGSKKKRKKKREVPYINIKIDNREDNDVYDRKVYKGGRF